MGFPALPWPPGSPERSVFCSWWPSTGPQLPTVLSPRLHLAEGELCGRQLCLCGFPDLSCPSRSRTLTELRPSSRGIVWEHSWSYCRCFSDLSCCSFRDEVRVREGGCFRKSVHTKNPGIRLQCGRPGFDPWVRKIPWRRERLPTPVFWPGECHGPYSPWGCKAEHGSAERLSLSLPVVKTSLPGAQVWSLLGEFILYPTSGVAKRQTAYFFFKYIAHVVQ